VDIGSFSLGSTALNGPAVLLLALRIANGDRPWTVGGQATIKRRLRSPG
jgi:hypothetical protein